jgi:DNA-binding NarL/FixJ family response regulator
LPFAQEDTDLARIRILLVDDHELIRRNIRRLLAAQPDFDLVGEAIDGRDAISRAGEHQPDIILLDIGLPEINGLAALPLIRAAAPAAKVLMVTNHDDPNFARASLAGGASGFVTKSDVSAQLAFAIRQVHANETFLSKSITIEKEVTPIVPSVGTAEA